MEIRGKYREKICQMFIKIPWNSLENSMNWWNDFRQGSDYSAQYNYYACIQTVDMHV
jgi:hypothetical protein